MALPYHNLTVYNIYISLGLGSAAKYKPALLWAVWHENGFLRRRGAAESKRFR